MITVLLVVVVGVVVVGVVVVIVAVIGFVVVVVVVVVAVVVVVVFSVEVVKSKWYNIQSLYHNLLTIFFTFAKPLWKFMHKYPMQFSRIKSTRIHMNSQKAHEIR